MAGDAYTGLRRRKKTPWTVKFGDAFVSRIIAVGGIGTIAAILLVVLVLVGTALPLFRQPTIGNWYQLPQLAAEAATPASGALGRPAAYLQAGLDDNGLMLWGLLPSGAVEFRNLADGQLLARYPLELATGVSVTCSQAAIDGTRLAVGLSDGSFCVAPLNFQSTLISPAEVPAAVQVSRESPVAAAEGVVYQWFDANGVRRSTLEPLQWSEPLSLGDSPVTALDYVPSDSANLLSSSQSSTALAVVGTELVVAHIEARRNRLTKKVTIDTQLERGSLQIRSRDARPLLVALLAEGSHAVVAWPNGTLDRYGLANGGPELHESQPAAVRGGVTSAGLLLGRQTLMCGLEDGRLQGWMVVQDPTQKNADGYALALAHEVSVSQRPLIGLSSSRSSHVAATCDDQNGIGLVYVTTDTLLATEQVPGDQAVQHVTFGPDSQVLLAATQEGSYSLASLDLGHPEATFRGYFGQVWYEGHDEPKYIWQSSAATEVSEIKLSLMPLIFGTLKATFYAMLISVPLAIMTAIYTSEFLSPNVRGRVKPVIEMMASLPSVVLGYVAALVVAPYLQEHLMAVLVGMFVFPWCFILVGHLWNLLPIEQLVRLQSYRLVGLLVSLPLSLVLTVQLAPVAERELFGGSLVGWLAGREGSALGGWFLLLLPSLVVVWCGLLFGPLAAWQRGLSSRLTPAAYALWSLLKLGLSTLLVIAAAWSLGWLLAAAGLDLRGQLFDNYQDRNALLVGFALGFCVIPIVYTISDDALQSVPRHLRSASLGCGATPWQTTMRIVVPSAMSGLFSAVMIGLGRAVGETMVVLCAAGNTPLMEFNPFNGFKTLSAALATELPEAAKGSTHFRTLFLAAVLLFFMTLVVNTLAEFVRIRFRKRSSQL